MSKMRIALGIALVLFHALSIVSPARAAAFVVNATSDESDRNPGNGTCATQWSQCTLRAAIEEANATAAFDTITFAASINGTPINVNSTLRITQPISITGNGASNTVVQGADAAGTVKFSIFTIDAGVSLANLRVRNGGRLNGNDDGGGIYVNNGALALTGVEVNDNYGNQGGGLYVKSGAVVINPSASFQNNAARREGGALYVADGVVVLYGTISGGSAETGGGIYVAGGLVSLNGAAITGATAEQGGGLYVAGGAVSVTGSVFDGNAATSGGNAGGALYQAGGALSVSQSILRGNHAPNNTSPAGETSGGGAVYIGGGLGRSVTASCIVGNDDTAVVAGTSGVNATANWWGSANGPYTWGVSSPFPNDTQTAVSSGDSVSPTANTATLDYSDFRLSTWGYSIRGYGCGECNVPSQVAANRVSRLCY